VENRAYAKEKKEEEDSLLSSAEHVWGKKRGFQPNFTA